MTEPKKLIGIHNDSAHEELVKIYNRRTKVGKSLSQTVKCNQNQVYSQNFKHDRLS